MSRVSSLASGYEVLDLYTSIYVFAQFRRDDAIESGEFAEA